MAINIGMLWYDDNPAHTLEVKIERAKEHYQTKYGAAPNLCYAHPATLAGEAEKVVAGVTIRPARTVLEHHFWIGVGDGHDGKKPAMAAAPRRRRR